MSQFMVSGLQPEITGHPLWQGSTLQQRYQHNTLSWADLLHETRAKLRLDDLSPREKQLCALLMAASDAWEAQWEID